MTQRDKSGGHLRLVEGSPEPRTDGELCAAFAGGEDAAFAALVRRHQELVYAVVRRYASAPDDARELAQTAFVKAFQAVRRPLARLPLRAEFPFRAWLLRIAINCGKNHARQSRRWQPAPLTLVEQAASGASPLEALERAERERLTRTAMLKLPKRQREVLTLRIDGGLPFSDVAQTLGITENNAKVHFHHAARRLKELIVPQVGEP